MTPVEVQAVIDHLKAVRRSESNPSYVAGIDHAIKQIEQAHRMSKENHSA